MTPKQILLGAVLLIGIAALVGAIAFVTQTEETVAPAEGFAPAPTRTEPEPTAASIPDGELEPTSPTETGEPELLHPLPAPVVLAAPPQVSAPGKAASPPRGSVPAVEAPAPPDPKPPKSAAPAAKSRAKTMAGPRTPPSTKEPDDAVVQAELASMQPDELTARADALYAQGHSALASSYYRRALEIDPDYAPALVGIGQSILRAKKYSEAMRNATRALQLARGVDARPGLEAAAIYQLGRVHYERGERDAARHLFRQSISLPGTPAEAWFYLGEALSSDNSPAARHAYEKYLELVSDGHLADRARRAIQ